jgi:hypothetical protein
MGWICSLKLSFAGPAVLAGAAATVGATAGGTDPVLQPNWVNSATAAKVAAQGKK